MNTTCPKLKTTVAMILALCLGGIGVAAPAPLEKEFINPPDSARMWTWWFWLKDNVDEQSITADL